MTPRGEIIPARETVPGAPKLEFEFVPHGNNPKAIYLRLDGERIAYRGKPNTPQAAARAKDAHAPLTQLSDDQVLTPHEWCRLKRISERSGWRILHGPDGPEIVQLSARRIGITVGANRRWQHARART